MGMLQEFKAFAMRGNVVDMAVGIIIGGAFGRIITSLVNDIIMPPIGRLTGGVNFSDMLISLDPSKGAITSLAQAQEAGAAVIAYGQFINIVINFIIVAFAIFMMIKLMNTLKRKEEAKPAAPPPPPAQEVLLTEIRDLLKARG
ncbi:MAG TPA: large conductance mechanosensitive channel protein MscL [Sedimentisphaerales bacterium]|nr:large conductance mechanosensitive channel protein MscL [Sedimentisphaerales bacterium]